MSEPDLIDGVPVSREAFAHDASLEMGSEEELGAPGAAITISLCGHWEHQPPCPLSPHHTSAVRVAGGEVTLRTLFAVEPARELDVRSRIDSALAAGRGERPDGSEARWELRDSRPGAVRPDELDHAQRLIES